MAIAMALTLRGIRELDARAAGKTAASQMQVQRSDAATGAAEESPASAKPAWRLIEIDPFVNSLRRTVICARAIAETKPVISCMDLDAGERLSSPAPTPERAGADLERAALPQRGDRKPRALLDGWPP